MDDSRADRPAARAPWTSRLWPFVLVGAALTLLAERVVLLSRRTPAGADEALYLMEALDWLGRIDKLSTDPTRTRGVPAMIYPIASFTDGTWAYRSVVVILGVAVSCVTYLIGRRFLGRGPAAFAAVMLGLSSASLLGSVALLPDIPAALGIAISFLFYWRRVVHAPAGEPLRHLWPIALGIAFAFYFNIAFAALAGLTLGLDFLIFRRRDLFSRATIEAAVVLGALLAPYFFRVWIDHGVPWYTIAIHLRGSAKLGGPLLGGDPGYEVYARWFFDSDRLFGSWGFLVLLGFVVLLVALVRGRPIPRRDACLLGLWVVLPTIGAALLFHAELRYLLPWLPAFYLVMALPLEATARWVRSREPRAGAATAALAVIAIAGMAQFAVTQYRPAQRRLDGATERLRIVHGTALKIDRLYSDPPCQIFTRQPREFELRTGCRSLYYSRLSLEKLLRLASERPDSTFFVWWQGLQGDPHYQPSFVDGLLARQQPLFTIDAPGDPLERAIVYRYVAP